MNDVVVDCDVVGHTLNPGAGDSHHSATLFVSALVESNTNICLDEAGYVLGEYESLGLTRSNHPLVKSFIRHLVRPGGICVVEDNCLDAEQRQAVGHLPIDQHDKRYIRITSCTSERWLVSNDLTYAGTEHDVLTAAGVTVEHSSTAVGRLLPG